VLRTLVLAILLVTAVGGASPAPVGETATVAVAPARTSIYLGTVSLAMPPFRREGETYHSTYVIRVFPFFFYNERGALSIDVPAPDRTRLLAGETVTFSGRAANADGAPRRIEGSATPTGPRSGKLKVRVFVTRRIELVFNTTYTFVEPPAPGDPDQL
jgi:hypothetical protein